VGSEEREQCTIPTSAVPTRLIPTSGDILITKTKNKTKIVDYIKINWCQKNYIKTKTKKITNTKI